MPGPQLVVPVSNARYVLNAANARWGSLYEALYGTDAISSADGGERGKGYNKIRGARVIAWGRDFLDACGAARRREPQGRHSLSHRGRQARRQARRWSPRPDCKTRRNFAAIAARPVRRARFCCAITACISRSSSIARAESAADDPAGVADIVIEAALTAIMDLEDSVAAVDAADKVELYRNLLGLMQGTISRTVEKNGRSCRAPSRRRTASISSPTARRSRCPAAA